MSINEKNSPLVDLIKEFVETKRDKKLEDLLKSKPKKDKNGLEKGGINSRLEKLITATIDKDNPYFGNFDTLKKAKKGKDETSLDFQVRKYSSYCDISQRVAPSKASSIVEEYRKVSAGIQDSYIIKNWLDKKSVNAVGVSFATHVIKLTHSRIKGATSIVDQSLSQSTNYLITTGLDKPALDSALDNAAYADIADLLKLRDQHKSFSEYIMANDSSALKAYSDDSQQIDRWMENLSQSTGGDRLSSHLLAKQIYFPIRDEKEYQLLLPIVSSSLAQALHVTFSHFFDEKSQAVRMQRKTGKYASEADVYYPNKATIKVTASNHTNASTLNGKRGGKLTLLSCAPPSFQQNLGPPKTSESVFTYQVSRDTKQLTDQLQTILLKIKYKKLSVNSPSIHKEITDMVDGISDILFGYISAIQSQRGLAGWSSTSSMRKSHKLLLDIYNADELFQKERVEKGWKKEIIDDFSKWLNHRLKHKGLTLGEPQGRLWRDLFRPRFTAFMAQQEITL